jgi:hypothetical protein
LARKGYECFVCDAAFRVKHDLDDNYYKVEYCAFCGNELSDEEELSFEDEDEDDNS